MSANPNNERAAAMEVRKDSSDAASPYASAAVTPAAAPASSSSSPCAASAAAPLNPGRSFSSLSEVETQLIMQLLDTRSLLFTSRCSRQLRKDAQGKLAWKTKVFALDWGRSSSSSSSGSKPVEPFLTRVHSFLSSPLAGRIRVSLSIYRAAFISRMAEEEMDAILRLPQLTSLHAFHSATLSTAQWHRLLTDTAVQESLQSLCLGSDVDQPLAASSFPDDALKMLAQAPNLHTLRIMDRTRPELDFKPLKEMKELKNLYVIEPYEPEGSTIPFIAQGSSLLRSLSLRDTHSLFPVVRGGAPVFRSLFTSPSLKQLRFLYLNSLGSPAQVAAELSESEESRQKTKEDYAAAFRALVHLTAVRMWRVCEVDALVSQVHNAPALASLFLDTPLYPSFATLLSFLQQTALRRPPTKVTLRFGPSSQEKAAALGELKKEFKSRVEFI